MNCKKGQGGQKWSLFSLVCSKGWWVDFFLFICSFFTVNNKVFLLIYVVVLLNLRYGSEEIASYVL